MASCAKITFSFPNRVLSERTFLLPFQQDDLFADTEEVYVSNTGDEDLLLEAETFFDKEVKQTKDSFLLLKPGDKFLISSSQYPNLYYLPGTYELKTSTLDKVSSFSVVTNIKDEQNLVELVSALERFQKHLTINFSRVENDYLLRLKKILNEYDLKIQKAISRIERNPDKIICKKYYLSQSKAVQDYKTERLNDRCSSRKGYYSVKKVLSYDTGYNRRLKHSLRNIIISMKNAIEYINDSYMQNEYTDCLIIMRKLLDRLCEFRNKPFFNNVKETRMNYSYAYNTDYHLVNNFNKALLNKEAVKVYQRKRTSVLYELYGLVIINAVLSECGFQMEGSADIRLEDFHPGMKPLIYLMGTYKAVVNYDAIIKNYREDVNDELVTINSRKNRPDFTIELFENDQFINAFVLEMKYRSSKNVLPMVIDDKKISYLDDMIDDYVQFAFKTKNDKLIRNAVDSLYIIYPDDKLLPLDGHLGYYLGALPNKNLSSTPAVQLLIKKINEVISKTK